MESFSAVGGEKFSPARFNGHAKQEPNSHRGGVLPVWFGGIGGVGWILWGGVGGWDWVFCTLNSLTLFRPNPFQPVTQIESKNTDIKVAEIKQKKHRAKNGGLKEIRLKWGN